MLPTLLTTTFGGLPRLRLGFVAARGGRMVAEAPVADVTSFVIGWAFASVMTCAHAGVVTLA